MTRHVLVVEDEPTILRGFLRAIDRDPGLRATGCYSVDQAVDVLGSDPPDLLVTDLNLPGRHGLEMINELDNADLHIPIIVVTAFRAVYEHWFPEQSELAVLEKPVSMSHLLNVIHSRIASVESRRPSGGFQVADYLQLAGMGRSSVVLRASLENGKDGWLEIVEGDVWNAYYGKLSGEQAVAALMYLPAEAVATQALAEPPKTRQIERSLEGLLLDLARREDEGRRDRPEIEPDMVLPEVDAAAGKADGEDAAAESSEKGRHERYIELMEAGMNAVNQEGWDAAVAAFEAALELVPDDPRARHNLERSRRLLREAEPTRRN